MTGRTARVNLDMQPCKHWIAHNLRPTGGGVEQMNTPLTRFHQVNIFRYTGCPKSCLTPLLRLFSLHIAFGHSGMDLIFCYYVTKYVLGLMRCFPRREIHWKRPRAADLYPFFIPKYEGAEKGHADRSELRSCHRVNRRWYESGVVARQCKVSRKTVN